MSSTWTGSMVKEARDYWRARLAAEPLPCSKCGQPVQHTDAWDVDHPDSRVDGGPLGRDNQWPAHRACNRRDGQRISTARKGKAREMDRDNPRLWDAMATPAPAALLPLPVPDLSSLDPATLPECQPAFVSDVDPGVDMSPFDEGCRMIGLTPTPAQVLVAQVILSGLHRRVGISIPRRAGKTTIIAAVLLGLCATRPYFTVAFSAQSGIKSRDRFEELVSRLNRYDQGGPWTTRHAAGAQMVKFANGSRFLVRPPKGDAFRGDAADVTWLDEAQEFDVPLSRELLGAILPTMDTSPTSVLIVSGTPGERREGMLWETLERGRSGAIGIVEYAAPEDAEVADPVVWWATHPGLSGGLTTLETIAERFGDMDPEQFAREYLGIWPVTAASALIDPEVWATLRIDAASAPADGSVVVGWDCDPSGLSAAVWLGWKSDYDRDVVTVVPVKVADGTSWVAAEVDAQVRDLKARAVYDPIGPNIDVAAMLTRLRTPRVSALRGADLKGGYASMLERVSTDRLRHVADDDLDKAVVEAARRPFGESWLWRRTPSSPALVAATHVAWVAGNSKRRAPARIRSVAG